MSDPLSVAQSYFDAWNRRDAAGIVACFATDGSYTDPLAPGLRGEALAAHVSELCQAFPDLSFEIGETILTGGNRVAAQWLMKGTNTGPFRGMPPTGRSISLKGADFIEVEGGKIRSVTGYYDAGEVPRQLGMQVMVQPDSLGPFRFGYSVSVRSGKNVKPRAFSITMLLTRSEEEKLWVQEFSRKIAAEMLDLPGFIGWTGLGIGNRLMTVTAWTDPEAAHRLSRHGTHSEARTRFFADLASGGYTSVWVSEGYNPTWVRCTHCGRMMNREKDSGRCACGENLPEPEPYW
jgi:steroid delta-isomerase-like uncharacterized protein